MKFLFKRTLFGIAPKESGAETAVRRTRRKRVKTNKEEKTKAINKERRARKMCILKKNSNSCLKIIISKYRRKSPNTKQTRATITKIVERLEFNKKMKDKRAEKLN